MRCGRAGPWTPKAELDGASLETLFLEALRAHVANARLDYELSYWRTPTGAEVDFVAYGPKGLVAFELTRSSVFREADLAGLRLFCEDSPQASAQLLYGGTKRYRFGAIDVLPFEEGLLGLPALLAAGRPK